MDSPRPPGKTTIDSGVLLTIARLSTLSIEGVAHMGEVPGNVRDIFKRNHDQGVRINVEDSLVDVDVHVVLEKNTDIRAVSREIQGEISRAICDMVGMKVGRINVHIDDIDFPEQDAADPDED